MAAPRSVTQREALGLVNAGSANVEGMMQAIEADGPINWAAPMRWGCDWAPLDGRYLMGFACKQGSPELVRALIVRGCDLTLEPDIKGPAQMHNVFGAPIHEAASGFARDAAGRVRTLLEARIKPDQRDRVYQRTPLHIAVKSGTYSGVVFPDEDGQFTYEAPATGERAAVLAMLVAAGHPVDAKDREGRTPIEEAIDARSWLAAAELLRLGSAGQLDTPWKPLHCQSDPPTDRWHGCRTVGAYLKKVLALADQKRDPIGSKSPHTQLRPEELEEIRYALEVYHDQMLNLPVKEFLMRAAMVRLLGPATGGALGRGWLVPTDRRPVEPAGWTPTAAERAMYRLRKMHVNVGATLNIALHGRPDGTRSRVRERWWKHRADTVIVMATEKAITSGDEPFDK